MPTSQPLKDQVAVVTGGSKGIGMAVAQNLSQMGASVVITGRNETALRQAEDRIQQHGGSCLGYQADVCHWPDMEELAQFVAKDFGRIDILVNNAGVGYFGTPLHEMEPDEWNEVLNTNLRGVFYGIKAFAPAMIARKTGHIINVSSIASKNALPKGAAYAASKWGLNGLSYSVAEELRNYNIRVSVVCPGSTLTDLGPHAGKDETKMLKPSDVAHVVAMLVTQAPQSFASEIILRPTCKP